MVVVVVQDQSWARETSYQPSSNSTKPLSFERQKYIETAMKSRVCGCVVFKKGFKRGTSSSSRYPLVVDLHDNTVEKWWFCREM